MSASVIIVFIYGVLVAAGGIGGYAMAKSMMSLLAGVISGVLLLVGGWGMMQGQAWGKILAIVVTVALIGFFGYRYLNTGKIMPAGPIIVLGVITIATVLLAKK